MNHREDYLRNITSQNHQDYPNLGDSNDFAYQNQFNDFSTNSFINPHPQLSYYRHYTNSNDFDAQNHRLMNNINYYHHYHHKSNDYSPSESTLSRLGDSGSMNNSNKLSSMANYHGSYLSDPFLYDDLNRTTQILSYNVDVPVNMTSSSIYNSSNSSLSDFRRSTPHNIKIGTSIKNYTNGSSSSSSSTSSASNYKSTSNPSNILHNPIQRMDGPNSSSKSMDVINPKRRERTVFTEYQLEVLENTFKRDRYPDYDYKYKLSTDLNLSESIIQIWFKNRRAKEKRITNKDETMNYSIPDRNNINIKSFNQPMTFEMDSNNMKMTQKSNNNNNSDDNIIKCPSPKNVIQNTTDTQMISCCETWSEASNNKFNSSNRHHSDKLSKSIINCVNDSNSMILENSGHNMIDEKEQNNPNQISKFHLDSFSPQEDETNNKKDIQNNNIDDDQINHKNDDKNINKNENKNSNISKSEKFKVNNSSFMNEELVDVVYNSPIEKIKENNDDFQESKSNTNKDSNHYIIPSMTLCTSASSPDKNKPKTTTSLYESNNLDNQSKKLNSYYTTNNNNHHNNDNNYHHQHYQHQMVQKSKSAVNFYNSLNSLTHNRYHEKRPNNLLNMKSKSFSISNNNINNINKDNIVDIDRNFNLSNSHHYNQSLRNECTTKKNEIDNIKSSLVRQSNFPIINSKIRRFDLNHKENMTKLPLTIDQYTFEENLNQMESLTGSNSHLDSIYEKYNGYYKTKYGPANRNFKKSIKNSIASNIPLTNKHESSLSGSTSTANLIEMLPLFDDYYQYGIRNYDLLDQDPNTFDEERFYDYDQYWPMYEQNYPSI